MGLWDEADNEARLTYLKWKTVSKYGREDDVKNARRVMTGLSGNKDDRPAKRKRNSPIASQTAAPARLPRHCSSIWNISNLV